MFDIVDRSLLGSWMEKEFKKQNRVKFISFRFLCEILGSYLRIEDIVLGLLYMCKRELWRPCIGWVVVMDCKT